MILGAISARQFHQRPKKEITLANPSKLRSASFITVELVRDIVPSRCYFVLKEDPVQPSDLRRCLLKTCITSEERGGVERLDLAPGVSTFSAPILQNTKLSVKTRNALVSDESCVATWCTWRTDIDREVRLYTTPSSVDVSDFVHRIMAVVRPGLAETIRYESKDNGTWVSGVIECGDLKLSFYRVPS